MSLQGIFDPMVKNYFKNKFGGESGGSSAADSSTVCYVFRRQDLSEGKYEVVQTPAMGKAVKISDDLLTIGDYESAVEFTRSSITQLYDGVSAEMKEIMQFPSCFKFGSFYSVEAGVGMERLGLPTTGIWVLLVALDEESAEFYLVLNKK